MSQLIPSLATLVAAFAESEEEMDDATFFAELWTMAGDDRDGPPPTLRLSEDGRSVVPIT